MNGDRPRYRALDYTLHAETALKERNIAREWVERTVYAPALIVPDSKDPEIERFYRAILENGNRVLRVAVNTSVTPWRVVSAFFDRDMRGRI